MSEGGGRLRWDRIASAFVDVTQNAYIATSQAVGRLRAIGGAIRDDFGRFVPQEFVGGIVGRIWPTGGGNITSVTRRVTRDVEATRVREQDALSVRIRYAYQGQERESVATFLPKGLTYDERIARERVAARVVGELKYSEGIEAEYDDVEILEESWDITTFYGEGDRIGGDFSWFEGQR